VHLAVRGYGSRRFKLHVYAVRSSSTLDLPRRWLRIEEFTNGNALLRCSYGGATRRVEGIRGAHIDAGEFFFRTVAVWRRSRAGEE
jgi:hypothetical protein